MTYTTSTPIKGASLGDPAKIAAWAKAEGCARPDDLADYLDTLYTLCRSIGLSAHVLVAQSCHETADPDTGVPWASYWWTNRLGCIAQPPPFASEDAIDLRLADAVLTSDRVLTHPSQREQANLCNVLPVQFRARFPARILGKRQRAHMVGIDTRRVVANVVGNHALRKRAEAFFVVPAMGGSLLAVSPQSPVSVLVKSELPNPASGLGINNVLGLRVRSRSHVVSKQIGHWFPADVSLLRVSRIGEVGFPTAAAAAISVRDFWGRIGVHFWDLLSRFRGAVPRAVDAAPGFSRTSIIPDFRAVMGFSGV